MSNLLKGVNFRLSSLEDFGNRSLAESILRAFISAPSCLRPEKYGREQPLRALVSGQERMMDLLVPQQRTTSEGPIKVPDGLLIMEFAPRGEYLIHWKRHTAPSFAGISGSIPSEMILAEPSRFGDFLALVKTLVEIANPVYGDVQNMEFHGWDTPLDLQKRLPDVPWLSIYGPPYIQFFGEEKILSAPFFKIERLRSGHFWLQSTDSIYAPVPEAIRIAIRRHFGEDSFMAHPKWRYKDGKAPEFDFSNMMPKA